MAHDLDASGSRPETSGKFWNVVLENDGEDQLDRSCEKWRRWSHILRRNCLLKQDTEGKMQGQIEVTRRQGRRRKKLLDDFGDKRGYSHLKEEALDRIKWRNRFRRSFGPVVWHISDDDDNDDGSWCGDGQHFTPAYLRLFIYLFIYLYVCLLFILSLIYCFIHSFIHSFTHSYANICMHSCML
jgi:hypothetical protein